MAPDLQFVEGLSDRQAADAVRARIDWKYALGLELGDPGFDHTVLSEFRSRVVHSQAERQLLVTCPAGKDSISWLPNTYPQNGMVFEARFARRDCTQV